MATERRDFTDEEIQYAWDNAKKISGKNPDQWRQDYAGAHIWKCKYGDTTSQYGWEVDHLKPLAKNGTYAKDNLMALQWENNRHKGDNYPHWETNKSFDGANNSDKIQYWQI